MNKEVVISGEKFNLYWIDPDKTILELEVEKGWTWGDAHSALTQMDQVIMSVPYDVYCIYHFKLGAGTMPKNFAMPNLKTLLDKGLDNEKMVILVKSQSTFSSLLNLMTKIYGGVSNSVSKIQFVNTLDEALCLIDDSKRHVA